MWRPAASVKSLRQRAEIVRNIRCFFDRRSVFEVDVPALGDFSVSDPYLDALMLSCGDKQRYLQTSPEYFMKRLLAAGSGDIYYLGKAFRADEKGRFHHPEFTILEWYRVAWNEQQLIHEMFDLMRMLAPELHCEAHRYDYVFKKYVGINPHTATADSLAQIAQQKLDLQCQSEEKSVWLDLLFSHLIEPELVDGFYAIYDYPSCQVALAKIADMTVDPDHLAGPTPLVAKRFECFFNGIEIANGYWELTDAVEQKKRFEQDNELRKKLGKPTILHDENLLSALASGLPECAGVALGVDRLVTALLGLNAISEQRAFDF